MSVLQCIIQCIFHAASSSCSWMGDGYEFNTSFIVCCGLRRTVRASSSACMLDRLNMSASRTQALFKSAARSLILSGRALV